MVEVTGSSIYEELRRRGLLHLVRRKLEKSPISTLPRSDDDKRQALLEKVRKMKIKSIDELLRYKPLCKELEERGMLLEVMHGFPENAALPAGGKIASGKGAASKKGKKKNR